MIYFVVPRFIKDSKSNKSAIGELKKLNKNTFDISESIEFDINSMVVPIDSLHKDKKPYVISNSDNDLGELNNKISSIKPIKDLDAKEIFGTRIDPGFQIRIGQENGTPYQLSTRKDSGDEHQRVESWYLLGGLKMTLGLKEDVDIKSYKSACSSIYDLSTKLAKDVKSGKMTIREANKQLEDLIEVVRPDKYVNKLPLKINSIIDLSKAGIHYSVEEEPTNPGGTLVYKVMRDSIDAKSIFKSYAKGEMSENGELTTLNIDEYFENVDANIVDNNTKNRIKTVIKLKDLKNWKLNKIFNLTNYQTDELILFKDYKIEDLGFRHLYIREGQGVLKVDDDKIDIFQGESYIIPFSSKVVMLKNTTPKTKPDEESKLRVMLTYKREHLKR